jgi:transposase-like protein
VAKRDIPPKVRKAIADAVRAGGSCRGVAREHGVSPATVSKIAAEAGLDFVTARTAKATAARTFDAKAFRAELMQKLYLDAERYRQRAWEPYTQVLPGPGGPELVTTKLPPAREQQSLATAMGIAIDKAAALEHHDSSDGLAAGRTMVNDLFGALQLAHHQLVTQEAAGDTAQPGGDGTD